MKNDDFPVKTIMFILKMMDFILKMVESIQRVEASVVDGAFERQLQGSPNGIYNPLHQLCDRGGYCGSTELD